MSKINIPEDGDRLKLTFDQYQRYKMVGDIISVVRHKDAPMKLLDVGFLEGELGMFLTEDRIVFTDLRLREGLRPADFVYSSGTCLPFRDRTFDFAVSIDTLEHIAPPERESFVSELLRASAVGIVVAAPFHSPGVRQAEEDANQFHRKAFGRGHIWLDEHLRSPLPVMEETVSLLKTRHCVVAVLPNGFLPHWRTMIKLTLYMDAHAEYRPALEALNRLYNHYQYAIDNRDPSYRHVVIAVRREYADLLERTTSVLQPACSAVPERVDITALAEFCLEMLVQPFAGRPQALGNRSIIHSLSATLRNMATRLKGET